MTKLPEHAPAPRGIFEAAVDYTRNTLTKIGLSTVLTAGMVTPLVACQTPSTDDTAEDGNPDGDGPMEEDTTEGTETDGSEDMETTADTTDEGTPTDQPEGDTTTDDSGDTTMDGETGTDTTDGGTDTEMGVPDANMGQLEVEEEGCWELEPGNAFEADYMCNKSENPNPKITFSGENIIDCAVIDEQGSIMTYCELNNQNQWGFFFDSKGSDGTKKWKICLRSNADISDNPEDWKVKRGLAIHFV